MFKSLSGSVHPQIRPIRNTHLLFFLGLGIMAAAGIMLVLANTRLGAYTSDDTYYYVYPVRELAAGRGFHPSYIFAPLFPLALAGISLTGADALDAARWLNAMLFGVNIYLVGTLARRIGTPPGFALLAGALVLLSDVLVETHSWAMSEALAFTWMLLSLHLTLVYLSSQRRWAWWAAALTAGLTVLTRYAALPLAAAISLTLLFYAPAPGTGKQRIFTRLKEAILFGAAGLAPIIAYWLRNKLTSGQTVRYQNYFFFPLVRERLDWFLYTWFSLFIPGRLLRGRELAASLAILITLAAAFALLWWIYRNKWGELRSRLAPAGIFLLLAMVGMTLLMLYLARGFTELDVYSIRYLTPMLIMSLILLPALASQLWQVTGRWMHLAIIGAMVVFLAYYTFRTVDFSRQMAQTGLGYSNIGWHNSETIAYIRAHPALDESQMVSTGEMGIYFWTGRKPAVLANFPNPQALEDYLCKNDAVLFIMDQMPTDIYGLVHDDVVQSLELAQDFNDSDMYRCPQGR